MKSTALNAICPYCYRKVILAHHLEDYTPEMGDLALCRSCGEGSIFTPTLRLRRPSGPERDGMRRNPGYLAMRYLWSRRVA